MSIKCTCCLNKISIENNNDGTVDIVMSRPITTMLHELVKNESVLETRVTMSRAKLRRLFSNG